MNIWIPQKLARLFFIFVLAILLVNATYKVMFGAMPTSDKKGKTPLPDLPTIVIHPLSPPSTWKFGFVYDITGLKLRIFAPF